MNDMMARIASGELVAGDGDWHLVDVDPVRKRRKYYRVRDGYEEFMDVEDQEDLMVANEAIRTKASGSPKDDWLLVARVPLSTYFNQLEAAVEQQDDKYVAKWIDDYDNRGYKTYVGRT